MAAQNNPCPVTRKQDSNVLWEAYLYPYSTLSPQPPQIHSLLRSLGRRAGEQLQVVSCPSRHARDTLYTTPAEAMAWANAASRLAARGSDVL